MTVSLDEQNKSVRIIEALGDADDVFPMLIFQDSAGQKLA